MNNLFLTGPIGVGKSALLKTALKELNISTGGYITERTSKGYHRKYVAKSLYSLGEEYTIVKSNMITNSKIGLPEVFKNDLVPLLDKSLRHRDIIVMDELGCAENSIKSFTSKVFEVLDSNKIVFGILKDEECDFLNSIRNRDDVQILTITMENRNYILDKILHILKGFI